MNHPLSSNPGLRARLLTMTALTGLSAAFAWPAADAQAAGFALKEQSASAQGNAFAGATAGADDISYMFFNPAGLTRHDGVQAAVALSYVMPSVETDNAVANGTGTGGESASGDAAEDALVPALYGLWSLNPDLKFAIGINAPFGLSTKYSQTWEGRYDAVESAVTTVNINPAVAYRISPNLSVGAGLQIQYFDVTYSSMFVAGPLGDQLFKVDGDDWAVGFNLGAMYEFSESTRIGLSYRSRLDNEISGTATSIIASESATADITTPDSASFGLYHDFSDQFAVMGEVGWMGWSSFDQIRINLNGGGASLGGATTTVISPQDWEDVWFYALGATWKPNADWTIRGGLAFDQSPVTDTWRSPRLPDEDRTWVSIGAQFQPSPNFTVGAGYTHIFIDDAAVNLPDRTALGGAPSLTADFQYAVDVITLQGTFRF